MRIFLLSFLAVPFLASCGGSGGSNATASPSPVKGSGGANASSKRNCGEQICDVNNEYCYQEAKGANVINVSECESQPGGSCVIWQKDIGGGPVVSSACVKKTPEDLVCLGKSGVAYDSMIMHPDACKSGLDGTMGCQKNGDGLVVVTCFVQ